MNLPKIDRRRFIAGSAATAAALSRPGLFAAEQVSGKQSAESLVKVLYDTLTEKQKATVCFAWDHQDPKRGLLRTFVANNWNITPAEINSDFYTDDQRAIIRDIFEAIIDPGWHAAYDQQLTDDAGGFGNEQSIAIFGKPGDGKFEMVMTGRHMTLRCDGDSADHVAFGGPIFYGHAPEFNEGAKHLDNVFWPQAVAANSLYEMLDGKQRKVALLPKTPREQAVGFRGAQADLPGIPVSDLSGDQREHVQGVLKKLLEPYRQSDRDEVVQCLKTQGGLDACHLSFYSDRDIGNDGVWDNWRLEGPSFVWYFRGSPHVHVWVNVADSADVKTNA